MSIQKMNEGAHFLASSQDILLQNRISISVGTDFKAYAKVLEEERPQQVIGAPFDPALHNLNEGNAFWLIARDESGTLMHTQAAKTIRMRGRPLSQYMLQGFREFPPAIPDLDLDRSRYRAGPGAHRIRGTVVYHGEVWMGGPSNQYRGTGLSTVLARYGMMVAMDRWEPDYLFGFMAKAVAYKGFAERMGYMHNEPGSLRWYRKDNDTAIEGFLSYLSNEDIRFLLEMPLQEIAAQAA